MQEQGPGTRQPAALIGADIAPSAAPLKFVNLPFQGLRTKATNAHRLRSNLQLACKVRLF